MTLCLATEMLRNRKASYRMIMPKPAPVPEPEQEISIQTNDFVDLPDGYEYAKSNCKMKKSGSWKVYIRINTSEALLQWLKEYQEKSKTVWRIDKTYPRGDNLAAFRREYRCQHNTKPRSATADSRKASKNLRCPANLYIALLKDGVKGNESLSTKGFLASVVFSRSHNHSLKDPSTLKYRDVTEETKQRLIDLFWGGHSPETALQVLRDEITEGLNREEATLKLVDRSVYPDKQYCHRLYAKCFDFGNEHSKDSTETEKVLIEKMEKINRENKMVCVKLAVYNGELIITLCTPLMKRVHQNWPSSAKLVFMFSTSLTDGYSLYFLYTPWLSETLPLGCFMTPDDSTEALVYGLKTLLTTVKRPFYNHKSPLAFITDNSTTERNALRAVFPNSCILASTVELMNDFWRWIHEDQNEFEFVERKVVISMMESMLTAKDLNEADQAHNEFRTKCSDRSRLLQYVTQIYESREQWFTEPLENSTHHFHVIQNLMKDNPLHKLFEGNCGVSGMLDFIPTYFSTFYSRQLLNIANDQSPPSTRKSKRKSDTHIKKVLGSTYVITSSDGRQYICDTDLFVCTCGIKRFGEICQHLKDCRQPVNQTSIRYDCSLEEKALFAHIASGEHPSSAMLISNPSGKKTTRKEDKESERLNPECDSTGKIQINRKRSLEIQLDQFNKRLLRLSNTREFMDPISAFLQRVESASDHELPSLLTSIAKSSTTSLFRSTDQNPSNCGSVIVVKSNTSITSIPLSENHNLVDHAETENLEFEIIKSESSH